MQFPKPTQSVASPVYRFNEFTHTASVMNLVKLKNSQMYFISLPLMLSIWFSIMGNCVLLVFFFYFVGHIFEGRKGKSWWVWQLDQSTTWLEKIVFSQCMVRCQMEQPRCQKCFTVSKLLLMNPWILTACLLHPQRSSGMQFRVQAVTGFFSGRWYTMFHCETECFKFSLSRTTAAIPHRRGERTAETQMPNSYRDSAGSNLTTTKMSSQSQADFWGILSSPWAPCFPNWISNLPVFSSDDHCTSWLLSPSLLYPPLPLSPSSFLYLSLHLQPCNWI